MTNRRRAGNSLPQLLLLLVVLVGGIGLNYYLNMQAESKEPRPYRGYSDEELSALLGAYEQRKEGQEARYEARTGQRAQARGKAYFDEQVREFERVQRVNKAKAQARDALAGTQVVVKQIQAEQQRRAAEGDKMMLFLRRAFTLNR